MRSERVPQRCSLGLLVHCILGCICKLPHCGREWALGQLWVNAVTLLTDLNCHGYDGDATEVLRGVL